MDTVDIKELNEGDTILITGFQDYEILIVEVDEVLHEELLIIPKGMGGLDYSPEDPEKIIRIGVKDEEPIINPVSDKLHFKLKESWQKIFSNELTEG